MTRKLIPITIVTTAVAGVIGVIGVTGAASAQEEPEPPRPRADFVCSHLDQLEALNADHAALIADRLAVLADARADAEGNGDAEALERIDRRIAWPPSPPTTAPDITRAGPQRDET